MDIRYTTFAALTLLVASALAVPSVQAADFTGQIITLRYNTGATPARISIEVGARSTLCSANPGWFAFERADKGLQRLWHEALLAAWVNNQPVFIKSNGRCDRFGIEGVEHIEVRH